MYIYHSLDTVAELPDYIRLPDSSVSFFASSQVDLRSRGDRLSVNFDTKFLQMPRPHNVNMGQIHIPSGRVTRAGTW